MSEQENLDTDLTSYSLDDEDQLQPEDTLTGSGAGTDPDALDTSYSPPDSARGSVAFGTTAAEQAGHESIEARMRQEEPDPAAVPAPEEETRGTEGWGCEDPDGVHGDDDWSGDGDSQVGDRRAGRLVSDDEGAHDDFEAQSWGRDVGVDGGAASAEEAAMHVVDGEGDGA